MIRRRHSKEILAQGFFPTPPECDRVHAIYSGVKHTDLIICHHSCEKRVTCEAYQEHERQAKIKKKLRNKK